MPISQMQKLRNTGVREGKPGVPVPRMISLRLSFLICKTK